MGIFPVWVRVPPRAQIPSLKVVFYFYFDIIPKRDCTLKKLDIERFEVTLAGIKLAHPLMNAAGTCKLLEEVKELVPANTSAIIVGSITQEEREIKAGNRFWAGDLFSINCMELPNPGASYYQKHLPEMAKIAHKLNKPLFVSVFGFTPKEYTLLTEIAFGGGADLVELNLGCSNFLKDGKRMRPPCFSPYLINKILKCVQEKVGKEAKVAVKLAPFTDSSALQKAARIITQWRVVKAVTTTNTLPGVPVYDEEGKPLIDSEDGLAALGGPMLKPLALGNVKQLRRILPKHIDVIGCGGITFGKDIKHYLQTGAAAVQIATALLKFGPRVFDRLLIEFFESIKNSPI